MPTQLVLDTETTGLSVEEGHRIIEIGLVEIDDRRLTQQDWHQYLNPDRAIDAGAIAVHGITDVQLRDKPRFSAVAKTLYERLKGQTLVIHNAPFDVGFLDAEFARLNQPDYYRPLAEVCTIVDTLLLARELHPGQRNSLTALCQRYGVDDSMRERHGAHLDACLLAEVYLLMTGGQRSMFGDGGGSGVETRLQRQAGHENDSALHSGTSISADLAKQLKIVRATAEELAAHQSFLERVTG